MSASNREGLTETAERILELLPPGFALLGSGVLQVLEDLISVNVALKPRRA